MSPEPNPNQTVKPPFCLKKAVQSVFFYGAYCIFAGVGLFTSLLCFIPAQLFHSDRVHFFGQRLISRLFAFFVWYLKTCKLVIVDASELERLRERRGVIFVANHPSLLDVVYIVAHLPRVFCLMKASVVHNPILSGQALLAGYVDNESGPGLIKMCQEKLQRGENLLVFPEGTRTMRLGVNPFKMGFALLAKNNGIPVQTLIITLSQSHLGKNQPLLQPPSFPLRCTVRLGQRFVANPEEDVKTFGRRVQQYYIETLTTRTIKPSVLCCHER